MTDAAFARRAIALLDLTDLSNGLDEAGVERLCARAVTPLGPVAAVCLWAGFVPQARRLLRGTPVRIATVVNFPAGEDDVMRAADEARYALLDGADEIDVVLPWRSLIAGRQEVVGALLGAVRAVVPPARPSRPSSRRGSSRPRRSSAPPPASPSAPGPTSSRPRRERPRFRRRPRLSG